MREEREISVRIFTERYGFSMPFDKIFGAEETEAEGEDEPELNLPFLEGFSGAEDEEDGEEDPQETSNLSTNALKPEKSEFFAQAILAETDDRVEILYEESVLTGMEGSRTCIGFAKAEPSVVSMVRQGFVDTALVFEAGRRHLSVYQTPFAEFELTVCARSVKNLLLQEGLIELDYITELHGARAERCKMKIIIE